MTATSAAPLDRLAQQIARQQTELEALRREYEARQTHLRDLTSRRDELVTDLQQIEADIQATTLGNAPRPAPTPKKAPQATPARQTLAAVLVDIVGKAAGPVTVKELAEEVRRRKFPTTSANIPGLVDTRVRDLVKRGLLRRAPGQPGVLPAPSAPGEKPPATNGSTGPKAGNKQGGVVRKAAPRAGSKRDQVPLRVLLTNLLGKSRRPIPAQELAEQVLASGYHTKSKRFIEVVWVMLGKMDNVENVQGKGYTLKR